MEAVTACIAGEEIYRQVSAGYVAGRQLGRRSTPFGQSGELFLVEGEAEAFYLMARHSPGLGKTAAWRINDRANIYALKEMGVQYVLAWGPGGAITHNIAVGDLVLLDDVIDQTHRRCQTFFEDSALGFLRQFPVFCPTLRRAASDVLRSMQLIHHQTATAAVREGPRLETPAEIRMLTAVGAEVVTHNFVPEVFLARELELCYAAICYVTNYAETGSRHRPFGGGDLFGGFTQRSESQRLSGAVSSMSQIVRAVACAVAASDRICECDKTMQANRDQYNLADDWRKWFT